MLLAKGVQWRGRQPQSTDGTQRHLHEWGCSWRPLPHAAPTPTPRAATSTGGGVEVAEADAGGNAG